MPLLAAARRRNDSMPAYVAGRVIELLGGEVDAREKTVLLIGLAHKSNSPDLKNAPSLEIASRLDSAGVRVSAVDSLVAPDLIPERIRVLALGEVEDARPDLAVLITAHHRGGLGLLSPLVRLLDTRAVASRPQTVLL